MDSAKASCAATDSAAEDPWPAAGKSSLDIFIDIGLSVNLFLLTSQLRCGCRFGHKGRFSTVQELDSETDISTPRLIATATAGWP